MAAVRGSVHLQRCVVSPAGRHSASLIFLHGSGDSGKGLRMWIRQVLNQDLAFQHIKIIYPTAPSRPYTPMRGGISNVWFDRLKISNDCPEHLESIDVMCQVLTGVIDDEVNSGIKKSRILVAAVSGSPCPHHAFNMKLPLETRSQNQPFPIISCFGLGALSWHREGHCNRKSHRLN